MVSSIDRLPLRVVFMGSPEFAVPTLRAVSARHQVVGVVTQPDRPRGRGLALMPPPIKLVAQELGIELIQPERIRQAQAREQLARWEADVFVVVAFGQILPPSVLKLPRYGCLNVHASLLPRYRGAAPIQWAVLEGQVSSGVSIMLLDQGVDTGPVLVQQAITLASDETAGTLHDRLAELGAPLLLRALDGLVSGELTPQAQADAAATYAPMLRKEDGKITFAQPAAVVDARIRGLDPWPGAYSSMQGSRLRLYASRVGEGSGPPGQILALEQRGLLVACSDGAVWITELQPEGRRRMSAKAYAAGHVVTVGMCLGDDVQHG